MLQCLTKLKGLFSIQLMVWNLIIYNMFPQQLFIYLCMYNLKRQNTNSPLRISAINILKLPPIFNNLVTEFYEFIAIFLSQDYTILQQFLLASLWESHYFGLSYVACQLPIKCLLGQVRIGQIRLAARQDPASTPQDLNRRSLPASHQVPG